MLPGPGPNIRQSKLRENRFLSEPANLNLNFGFYIWVSFISNSGLVIRSVNIKYIEATIFFWNYVQDLWHFAYRLNPFNVTVWWHHILQTEYSYFLPLDLVISILRNQNRAKMPALKQNFFTMQQTWFATHLTLKTSCCLLRLTCVHSTYSVYFRTDLFDLKCQWDLLTLFTTKFDEEILVLTRH